MKKFLKLWLEELKDGFNEIVSDIKEEKYLVNKLIIGTAMVFSSPVLLCIMAFYIIRNYKLLCRLDDRLSTKPDVFDKDGNRISCECGTYLEPPEGNGNWGGWKCRSCGVAYCQDCGSLLDYNDECMAYTAMKEKEFVQD